MKQNVIQRLAQKYIRKQDKIPSNWKQIKIWIKEFSEYADMVLVVNKFAEEILELLKSEKAKDRQEIIEKIDKIYKKEQGIHNWLDLREKLKEEIKNENI